MALNFIGNFFPTPRWSKQKVLLAILNFRIIRIESEYGPDLYYAFFVFDQLGLK